MATALTPAGMQLVAELEQIRTEYALNSSDIAAMLECERHTANRYLRGHTTIPRLELKTLLKELGWKLEDARFQALMDMRDKASQPVWYTELGLTEDLNQLVGFESSATRIRVFEPMFVFGPLQTREYAHALIRGLEPREVSDEVVAQKVGLRLKRQQRIYQEDPPSVQVILAEAALRSNVGGPAVMAAQLEALCSLCDPWELRVLPLNVGAHPGMRGAFWLFDFEEPRRPSVYTEGAQQNIYLDDGQSVEAASVDFAVLWEAALGPDKSRQLLLQLAQEAPNA